jgi:MFS transporter, PAT family, beta-lactamase induction signal transducer AmpG
MAHRRRHAPIWLMGLSNSSFGLFGGFVAVVFPQLLAAKHVPEARIAALTGLIMLPGLLDIFVAPVLDVRFSRRLYATVLAGAASVLLVLTLLNQENVTLESGLLVAGFGAACLSAAALGGWLPGVIPIADQSRLSVWFQIANVVGGGVMAGVGMEVLRHLPVLPAALVLAAMVFLPTTVFLFMPAPGPDRRLAKESFGEFFRELFAMVRRRETLLAVILFAAPSSTFALTNILGGLGRDFNTSERMVSLLSGMGGVAAGIMGCFLLAPLVKRLPLRPVYLGVGMAGGLFTLSMLLLPRTAATFGIVYLGEGMFQALAFTTLTAITFETIGHHNPLAATQFSILFAANYLPLIYMQLIDGRGYSWRGVPGSFVVDAGISIAACLLLIPVVRAFRPVVVEGCQKPDSPQPSAVRVN